MALFDDIEGLLPGLIPAAWRGRQFWMINASDSVGRRIHQVLYPGLDLKTHDDTGPLDGPIRVSGLVIGDDYVGQADALRAAFRTPGPATLLHPWRGPIRCVLLRPATIEFDVNELRVARIDAEFDPVGPAGLAAIGTSLSGLLTSLTGLGTAATTLATAALSASPLAYALFSQGVAAAATVISVAEGWAGRSRRSAALLPAIVTARSAFTAATATADRASAARQLAAIAPALSSAFATPFKPQPASGIGPGDAAATILEPQPRDGATLMLTIAADLGRRLRPDEAEAVPGLTPLAATARAGGRPERSVIAAAEVATLTEAVRLVTAIAFVSRQEAQGWGDQLDEALRRSAVSVADLANEAASPAASLWRALGAARAKLAIDLSETIGRLPAVERLTPPGQASALLLAQHLAGDEPGKVIAFAQDIVSRNRLRHPATLGVGPIEILR
jgi:hypothetical protein